MKLPSLAKIYHGTECYQILTTIPGCGPVCFKSKHISHPRTNCSTAYCRHCSTYGHTSEDCASSKTYAASFCHTEQQQQEEVAKDKLEESDVNAGNIQSKTGYTDEGENDTLKVIPDTDYSTTQSTSTVKVNDEGSDVSTSTVCEQEADFQTV